MGELLKRKNRKQICASSFYKKQNNSKIFEKDEYLLFDLKDKIEINICYQKYNDSQQYNIQIKMTQYIQSLPNNPPNNNRSSNQFSQSLRVVDNPEAVLQELFLSSQDSDALNKFYNDPAYSYSPYHYNQRAQFSKDDKLNMKLSNRLELKELEEKVVRKLQVTEDILAESKQLIENQRMIEKLLRQLSQQSSITQNLMQEMSNNLNTITYYQKIWHHYNQQCALLDQSARITNNIPTYHYNYNSTHNSTHNSTRHMDEKVQKISVTNILNIKNNRQQQVQTKQTKQIKQVKQVKQTQCTKQKRKTQQSVSKEQIKKPSQRIVQSIRIYKNSQNKLKNESVLNFSMNSKYPEARNNISVKAHSKNKQNEYMSINSIEEQLKAVKEINKSYKSPSSFDKSNHNYVSIKNFASIDKSLSTDESIDQLFGNVELAHRASTPYNKSKMYKKVVPQAPWGQRNKSGNVGCTTKPCSGRKGEQKLSNIYQEYKYKLYNKGVDLQKNEFLQISYPNRSYNIEKNNSKNQISKNRMRNSSIFSNNKLTEHTPQVQVDKSSGRNKIMTVKIDVRGCK